ncbi:efflux RND transporter periplasmic adaptor subunit [Cystobacter fuscus]|uniref:efflux RND transporter periplasmic adaptor subunit n=1 Tax=Cystobacter fuscus TaxID=43 RepID=UPI002B304703|nr:efflux RND transporter periplasmic adaptor subunit [Cystobacter fuscus]
MRTMAAVLGFSVLAGCSGQVEQQRLATPPEKPAPGAEPTAAGSAQDERFLGVVLGNEKVEIISPFEGQLARLDVQPGDRLQAGTLMGNMALEQLRSAERMAQAQLDQAEADRKRIEAEAHTATERLQRYRKPPAGVLSTDEISSAQNARETALSLLDAARALIRERQASLAQIRQQLEEAVFRAPFDCVVAIRYQDPGTRVQAGAPILRLLQAGGFRVRFAIPEQHSARVTVGLPVRIFLPALGKEFPGKLESISPEVDTSSRMIFALATLHSSDEAVRAGMVARVSLSAGLSPPAPPSDGGQPGKNSGE